jgi:NAD(P)-dependent dehydrogenase (short-subunit alcohol dehydrogenase family)
MEYNSDIMRNSRQQQIALITGSSSGIGLETSLHLARNGIYTCATMRNPSKSKVILDFARKDNLPLNIQRLDITDEESISEAVDRIISEKSRIDIVVNNAGYSLLGPLEQLQLDEIKEEFETNFFGIIKLIQSVLPIMRRQGYGRIINISSLAGRIGFPLSSAYVSSKFALEGLVESLRYEVYPYGIHVSLIEPGIIKTNFINNMKLGKNVITSNNNNNNNNDNSPYVEIIQKRISAFKPRFEKGSSASEVADVVLEAVTSDNPKARYLVGEDALKMIEKRKNTTDEEFTKLVMNSVLGRDSSS